MQTQEERAGWQVSAWEAWFADPQLLASTPYNLMGPRIQGFPWVDPAGERLPVFTETKILRCKLLDETCRGCLVRPPATQPQAILHVQYQSASFASSLHLASCLVPRRCF